MPNKNLHEVCGHLGQNPETAMVPSGRSYCRISIATSNDYFDREKNAWEKRDPSWHRAIIWGPLGELVSERFKRGSSIMVRGRSHTRKFRGEDGVERFVTELIGTEVYKPIYVKRSNEPEPIDPESESSGDSRDVQKSMSLREEDDFMSLVESVGDKGVETEFSFGNNVKG